MQCINFKDTLNSRESPYYVSTNYVVKKSQNLVNVVCEYFPFITARWLLDDWLKTSWQIYDKFEILPDDRLTTSPRRLCKGSKWKVWPDDIIITLECLYQALLTTCLCSFWVDLWTIELEQQNLLFPFYLCTRFLQGQEQ